MILSDTLDFRRSIYIESRSLLGELVKAIQRLNALIFALTS